MSEYEYKTQREELKEEVKRELWVGYHKFPFFGYIISIIVIGWLLPKIYLGYNQFPILTLIVLILASIMFIFTLFYLCLSIKTHYNKIYNK